MNKKFYITCAIPYVNAAPHIGHALEFVQGDVIARFHRLMGEETILLSGGDENALKNVQAAEKAGSPVQQFIDENNIKFQELTRALGCQFDVWQKGSDTVHHFPASQKLWNLCDKAGDIYKKSYEGLYCVGCETFYEPGELNEQGECFEHPGKKLEVVKEENYFFRLSKYQTQIIELITSGKLSITPETRKNEVLSFLKQPLTDISISRSNERAKNWGVPVPNDDTQRMYVWFDALNIYQSGIGFGWDNEKYSKWWPADVHVIGKGISRFHAVYWPAFLLSAGLPTPKGLFVHGYFTVNGQKMSKTLGNVIDPNELIGKYSADPLRYYFLREIPAASDGDFSERRFKELYNAELANGLGNFTARVAKLCEQSAVTTPAYTANFNEVISKYELLRKQINEYRFDEYIKSIQLFIAGWDQSLEENKPWQHKDKIEENLPGYLETLINAVREVAELFGPIIPETSAKILKQFEGPTIKSASPMFPRLT